MEKLGSQPAVVMDNGTGVVKAGLAGNDRPRCVFASAVGRPKHVRVMPGGQLEGADAFVGAKVAEHRGALKISYPMEHGVVTDWADMERVWQHVYNSREQGLGVSAEEHPVLLTEAPLNPFAHREKAAEVFFESFSVPALFCAPQAILSLYASGRTTGLVLDSGDGVTHAVPIYEGFALPHAICRMDVAGRDVSEHLVLLLRRAGYTLSTSAERDFARQVKEDCCYVAFNPTKEEEHAAQPGTYRLPDGTSLLIGPERFRAPEVLFRPELIGSEARGAHECVASAIRLADLDLRKTLCSSMVLAGGSTLFPGFGDRLLNEVRKLSPKDVKIRIAAPPERVFSTWIGGSILASLATFKTMWVSRSDYEEHGAALLNRRSL